MFSYVYRENVTILLLTGSKHVVFNA